MMTDTLQWKMMESVRRMDGHIERWLHPFCTAHKITSLQLRILVTLHHKGPQTITMLAKNTCMAGANNSALCKKLEKDGLVRRARDPADERQVLVSLTPPGKTLVALFAKECENSRERWMQTISKQEEETISAGLDKLLAIFDERAPDMGAGEDESE